jgi:hypothetical protein
LATGGTLTSADRPWLFEVEAGQNRAGRRCGLPGLGIRSANRKVKELAGPGEQDPLSDQGPAPLVLGDPEADADQKSAQRR